MILIVSINFISFDAGSMSCFKTIQPINFMLFCFWLLLDLTTWITTINVHYDTKYGSQTWVHRGCLLILRREPFFNYTSLWKYLWWILLSQRASHSCSASQIQGGCLSAAVWVPVTAPTDGLPGWSNAFSSSRWEAWRGLGSTNPWVWISPWRVPYPVHHPPQHKG